MVSLTTLAVLLIPVIVFLVIIVTPSFAGSKRYTIAFGQTERSYLLHLPKRYDPACAYPLVIMLHGYGNTPKIAEWYSGWSQKADKEDFIVVYPRGTSAHDPFYLGWNAGFCCWEAVKQNIDDVGFIKALTVELMKNYYVDSKRIYVTGHSNGAMMAHRLGSELPEMITAIAPVGGAIGAEGGHALLHAIIRRPKVPLPVLMLHGKKDNVVPYEGGTNRRGTFLSFKDAIAFWSEINECSTPSSTESLKNGAAEKVTYACSRAPLITISVTGGQHAWFGSLWERVKYPFSRSISATQVVWDFFKVQSK